MQFSNSSGPHQLASAQPAGVSPHHEGFADFYSGGIARAYQVRDLSSVERNGLLAQNMLACLGRLERPGNVQMIGQGIIDGVDRRILEQFFVGSVCSGISSFSAAARAALRSREQIAATSTNEEACMAGTTLVTPILAVLRMPQRTFRAIEISVAAFSS